MTALLPMTAKVEELRRVFDRARALPFSSGEAEKSESLLNVRVSRDAYSLRVSEISGLAAGKKIAGLPSPLSEMLGLAGIRGALVPVYSLAALLGYGADAEQTRWLILCASEEPFALALNEFEGYVRVPLEDLHAAEKKDAARTHVTHVARTHELARAVISIPLIREAIQRRCKTNGVSKEQ